MGPKMMSSLFLKLNVRRIRYAWDLPGTSAVPPLRTEQSFDIIMVFALVYVSKINSVNDIVRYA